MQPPRLVATAVLLSLALPPRIGWAAPRETADQEASVLYEEGETLYETSDYAGAVVQFTAAYRKAREIEDPKRRTVVINALMFNLARAHKKAYGVDGDPAHLGQARELLQKHASPEEREVTAEELLREIETELARLSGEPVRPKRAETDPSDEWERTEAEREGTGERGSPLSSPAESSPPPDSDPGRPTPTPAASDKKMNGLMLGGIVLMASSAAGVGLAVGGVLRARAAEREFEDGPTVNERLAARDKGSSSNVMIAVGVAAAGALLVTGAILVGVGATRQKRRRVALVPFGSPTFAGARFDGRF